MLLSLSASVASGQVAEVQCVPGNPKECSVGLEAGTPAPIPGTLFSPHLAAWYILQARDIDASIASGVKHKSREMDIRLNFVEGKCASDLVMKDALIAERDETINNLSGAHRSPMLWTGVGAVIVSVIWIAVLATNKGLESAFVQATP